MSRHYTRLNTHRWVTVRCAAFRREQLQMHELRPNWGGL